MNSTPPVSGRIQVLAVVTAAAGAGLLAQPHRIAGWFSPAGSVPADAVVRVLGGRQLLQGAAQLARPTPDLLLAGVAADVLHLLSMIAAATAFPAYRRPALTSAAMSGMFAAAGARIFSSGRRG